MMKKGLLVVGVGSVFILLLFGLIPDTPLYLNWALLSGVILCGVLLIFFQRFERNGGTAKEVVLIATLAAVAGAVRIPFAAIAGLQPTTFMVMITGYTFGPQAGLMVGVIAALVSNFFLGQGPWTPWQMFAWGMCGASASLLAGHGNYRRRSFLLFCGLWGFLFGWIMNIWHWVAFVYPLTWETFCATYLASLPFDTLHAAGNILFSYVFGTSFYRILRRYQRRLTVMPVEQYQKR
jgi:energy-coupling factor transport system substrate-specific component